MTTWLVHGWAEDDGGVSSVGQLKKYINNTELLSHEWPKSYLWALLTQPKVTDETAAELVNQAKDRESVVCYSNGWQIALTAAQMGLVMETVVAIAPAGRADVEIPKTMGRVIILHSEADDALTWGQIWGSIWPWNSWGKLGVTGYKGDCDRVENWPGRDIKHVDWFDPEPLSYWGPKIAEALSKD